MPGAMPRKNPDRQALSSVRRGAYVGRSTPGVSRVTRRLDRPESEPPSSATSGIIVRYTGSGSDWSDTLQQWGDNVFNLTGWFPGIELTAGGVYAASAVVGQSSIASGVALQVALTYDNLASGAFLHSPPASVTPGPVAGDVTISCAMAALTCEAGSAITVIRQTRNLATGSLTNLTTAPCELTIVRLSD